MDASAPDEGRRATRVDVARGERRDEVEHSFVEHEPAIAVLGVVKEILLPTEPVVAEGRAGRPLDVPENDPLGICDAARVRDREHASPPELDSWLAPRLPLLGDNLLKLDVAESVAVATRRALRAGREHRERSPAARALDGLGLDGHRGAIAAPLLDLELGEGRLHADEDLRRRRAVAVVDRRPPSARSRKINEDSGGPRRSGERQLALRREERADVLLLDYKRPGLAERDLHLRTDRRDGGRRHLGRSRDDLPVTLRLADPRGVSTVEDSVVLLPRAALRVLEDEPPFDLEAPVAERSGVAGRERAVRENDVGRLAEVSHIAVRAHHHVFAVLADKRKRRASAKLDRGTAVRARPA